MRFFALLALAGWTLSILLQFDPVLRVIAGWLGVQP